MTQHNPQFQYGKDSIRMSVDDGAPFGPQPHKPVYFVDGPGVPMLYTFHEIEAKRAAGALNQMLEINADLLAQRDALLFVLKGVKVWAERTGKMETNASDEMLWQGIVSAIARAEGGGA